jgi:hypothetical protein
MPIPMGIMAILMEQGLLFRLGSMIYYQNQTGLETTKRNGIQLLKETEPATGGELLQLLILVRAQESFRLRALLENQGGQRERYCESIKLAVQKVV